MASALDGIRIVEVTQDIAGPYTGMLLAEQGAEVIKIEPPPGDRARGTPGFHVWNRSKRSVIADPTIEEGREFIHRLASTADVLLIDAQLGDEATLGSSSATVPQVPRFLGCSPSGVIQCRQM